MKILITGGCGYVGTELVTYLYSLGHSITILDAMWYGQTHFEKDNLRVIKGLAQEFQSDEWFDAIIHLAAMSNDPSVTDFPKLTWESNVLSTQNLLQNISCDTFILASSGSIYGLSDLPRVLEDAPLVPMSDYNKSKMVAERVALSYNDEVRVVCLRPGTVCGHSDRMRLDLAANAVAFSAALGEITIHGGKQTRPTLPLRDMVKAYQFALAKEIEGIYNVGIQNLSLNDMGDIGHAINPDATFLTTTGIDHRSYRLDSEKIIDAGFCYEATVEGAMQEVFDCAVEGVYGDGTHPAYYNAKWMRLLRSQ